VTETFSLQCLYNEFGCDEGGCIPLKLRCNDVKDCRENSDESDCQMFSVDANFYRKQNPPMNSSKIPTPVYVNMTINSVGSFEEIEMTFKVNFLISIMWYDNRLTFRNLKDEKEGENNLGHDRDEIWIPRLVFSNSLVEERISNDDFSSLEVLRWGKATLNSPSELQKNELFDGAENPLVYTRVYSLHLQCNFELKWYPFDFQECYIQVSEIRATFDENCGIHRSLLLWKN